MKAVTLAGRRRRSRPATFLLAFTAAALCAACQAPQPTAGELTAQRSSRADEGPIGSLGRIEPGDGIVRIATRSLSGQPSIVAHLLVKEGDRVRAGQVLADLDSKQQLEAAARQAAARIEVARRRLALVRAGAKPSDVAAQQAEVERLQGELENHQKEYQRYASLGNNATASEVDALKARVESTTRALTAARQRLASLSEVRAVDVDLAESELEEAIRNEARATAESKASTVYAPIDGRVIKVHAWPGAAVGTEGLLELAPIEPMYVVAEVAERDIARVKVGRSATISGDGLKPPIQGTVERVGVKVLQNELMPINPANFSDARVVEVWIKVDDSRTVADFIHLRVDVIIQP